MNISENGLQLIKDFEKFEANAYQDSGGIWTIGYGSIIYQNGAKVAQGDEISIEGANILLNWQVGLKTAVINAQELSLNQNQFDSLCSLVYNIGAGAFESSTILKEIKVNPSNPDISNQFLRWNRVNGNQVLGLTRRRQKEAELYFTPV